MKRFTCSAIALLALEACNHEKHDDKRSTERRSLPTTPTQAPDSPAAAAVRAYFGAATCEERAKLIMYPEHNGAELRAMGCAPIVLSSVDAKACDALDAGVGCYATIKRASGEQSAWLVKQTSGGYLIDFRATELRQPTLVVVRAELPTKPVVLRVWLSLSDYFNYEFSGAHATHYSIELSDPSQHSNSTRIYGYIAKDRPDAKAIFALVQDGQWHPATITLHYPPTKKSPTVAIIDELIAPSFYETEREHALDPD